MKNLMQLIILVLIAVFLISGEVNKKKEKFTF